MLADIATASNCNSVLVLLQMEYMIIKLDHKNRKARLSLRGTELLEVLREAEETNPT